MALTEFELIRRYFTAVTPERTDVLLGVGDDCALLQAPANEALAVTVDTLVEGRHFAPGADPEALGHKCLAVNLSDLAAMGAAPAWITLALTLPGVDESWLAAFSRGLVGLARRTGVALVGGDTTRGPLSITVQAHGFVPVSQALRREGAAPGDLVYVTGTLGDAGLALLVRQGLYAAAEDLPYLFGRLDRPEPRLEVGMALRGVASAAIDVSDGLAADLGHVCRASGVGATVYLEHLPNAAAVRRYVAETGDWHLPLTAGDDYELCLTVRPERQGELERLAAQWPCGLSWIGVIERTPGVRVLAPGGSAVAVEAPGFDHFAADD